MIKLKHHTNRGTIIVGICVMLSLLALFVIILNVGAERSYLYVQPVGFLLIVPWILLSVWEKITKNIGCVIILTQLFVRNVIIPMLMALGNNASVFSNLSSSYFWYAAFLMVYEVLACCLMIRFCLRGRNRELIQQNSALDYHQTSSIADIVIVILVLVCVVIWFLSSYTKSSYASIFSLITKGWKENYNTYVLNASGSARTLSALFAFLFLLLRIVVPLYLIQKMSLKKSNPRFIFSISLILAQFFFISSTTAEAFISAIILVYFIYTIYPEKRLWIIGVFGVGCLVGAVAMFYSQAMGIGVSTDLFEYLSKWSNSYLTGPSNVASTFQLNKYNSFFVFIDTILSSVPSVIRLDNLFNLNDFFGELYNGQIFSTIGSGFYIFGPVLAPLFSIFFTWISCSCSIGFIKADNIWKKAAFLYLSIQMSLAMGVYNTPISLSYLTRVGIPLLLISFLARIKIKLKWRKNAK